MAFDAINLRMGFEGLCSPGLGLPRYAEIAVALMEILPRLLPTTDSQVASLITVVGAKSSNGYDLLWRVLELAVPGFDPAIQVSAPVWMGDDIFEFCLAFVLYFRLMSKKGLVHDDHTKSITFLQAIREPAYVNVITTLHAYIDTFQSEDFGYLPPHLCMMGLAAQMHKNARARVRDIFPTARCMHGFQDPLIQGFVPPQVYRLDNTFPMRGLVYTPQLPKLQTTLNTINPLSPPPSTSNKIPLPTRINLAALGQQRANFPFAGIAVVAVKSGLLLYLLLNWEKLCTAYTGTSRACLNPPSTTHTSQHHHHHLLSTHQPSPPLHVLQNG